MPEPKSRTVSPNAVLRAVNRIETFVVCSFLVVLVTMVATQVVSRYALSRPPVWTEEFARYSMIWLTFLGAGLLAGNRAHIVVRALDRVLPRSWLLVLRGLVELTTAAVSGLLVVASFSFLERVSHQSSAAAQIPMSWVYVAVTIGFALVAAHSLVWLWRDLRELTGGPDSDELLEAERVGSAEDTEEMGV